MKSVLVVLSLAVALTVSAQDIDNSLDCLVNYLRINNLDDEVFSKVAITPNFYPSDDCKRRIKSEKDSVYISAYRKYERHPEISQEFDCFMGAIKNDDSFKNLLLKKKAIESIKLSWIAKLNPGNWLPGKKYRATKTIEANISAVEFENFFVCEYEKKFEENFDTFLDVENLNIRRSDEARCTKNYLERSTSATKSGVKGSLTLPGPDPNCDAFLNSIKARILTNLQSFYARQNKGVRKCITESLSAADYFSPEFRVKSFIENLAEYERIEEKKIYVEAMMNLFRGVLIKCTH